MASLVVRDRFVTAWVVDRVMFCPKSRKLLTRCGVSRSGGPDGFADLKGMVTSVLGKLCPGKVDL